MNVIEGLVIIFLGGIISGLFTTPARFTSGYEWENYWFLYSIFGTVVCPWTFAFLTTDAVDVLGETSTTDVIRVMASGFGWGIGSVTFGLGCKYVGDSLAFAIILGMCATLGTAVPMLILSPEDAKEKVGIFTWAGIAVVFVGLYFLAKAGMSKENDQKARKAKTEREEEPLIASINAGSSAPSAQPERSFAVGLVICVASGVFSGMMNVGLSVGASITDAAAARGADSVSEKNLTWALVISAGFIPNALYSGYLLSVNGTWGNFSRGPLGVRVKNALLGVLMGVLWYCGNFVYGAGASGIGKLGTVVGWPVFMVSMVFASTLVSVLAGDYEGVSARTVKFLSAGLFTILVAVIVVAIGSI